MTKKQYPSNNMEGILMSEEETMEILRNCSAYDKYLPLTKELKQEVSDFIQGGKRV